MSLANNQFEKLLGYLNDSLMKLSILNYMQDLSENEFTSTHLLPKIQDTVKKLNKQGLYVRGNGGPVVQPVLWQGVYFVPDITIDFISSKTIAFVVKIIRDLDTTGAFAKSIGQTLIYSLAGYKYSFTLIFDLREVADKNALIEYSSHFSLNPNSQLLIYKRRKH
jgi:hypothetical protein